jgi:1-acyl-sn-glycerol-3-phosphate acyltransferase
MQQPNKAKATRSFIFLRLLLRLVLRILFKLEIVDTKGRKAKFPKQGGYILASNHLSWLDPFLFLAFAPAEPRIYFMAEKRGMVHSKFRNFMTNRIGGVIHVDTDKKNGSLGRELKAGVAETLAGGGVLGIFPEGQVIEMETGQLLPFKKGIGYFAIDNNAPVLPVAIGGSKELYFRKRIKIVVGEMIDTEQLATLGKGKIAAEVVTSTTQTAIAAIMPEFEPFDPQRRKFLRTWLTELFNINPESTLLRMERAYRDSLKQPKDKNEEKIKRAS